MHPRVLHWVFGGLLVLSACSNPTPRERSAADNASVEVQATDQGTVQHSADAQSTDRSVAVEHETPPTSPTNADVSPAGRPLSSEGGAHECPTQGDSTAVSFGRTFGLSLGPSSKGRGACAVRSPHAKEQVACRSPTKSDYEQLHCFRQMVELNLVNPSSLEGLQILQGIKTLQRVRVLQTSLAPESTNAVSSLEPLQGLSLTSFELLGSDVTSLEPLRGQPLKEAVFVQTKLIDLSPVAGEVLERLHYYDGPLASLWSLRNANSLAQLSLDGLPNLRALTGAEKLTSLEHLVLDNTMVTSLTPLSGLSHLTSLIIRESPVTSLTFARSLKLARLSLIGTAILDLEGLETNSTLEELEIEGGNLQDASALKTCPKLRTLRIKLTRLHTLDLPACPSLVELDLRGSPMTRLGGLAGSPQLVEVDLGESTVSSLDFVNDIPAVRVLLLDHTRVSDLSALGQLKAVKSVSLANTLVSDLNPLANLQTLVTLDLANTRVSELRALVGLSELKTLRISGARVSTESLEDFKRRRPDVQID